MPYCGVVILDIVSEELDKLFTYRINQHWENNIQIGSIVTVPFGGRKVNAVVVAVYEETDVSDDKVKDVGNLLSDYPLPTDLLKLAYWMSDYYICSLSKALNVMIPQGIKMDINRIYRQFAFIKNFSQAKQILSQNRAPKQKQILNLLQEEGCLTIDELLNKIECTRSPINTLVEQGVLEIKKQRLYREPVDCTDIESYKAKLPTQEQKTVLKLIEDNSQQCEDKLTPIVLFGVTGSGKTEIYLQLINKYLNNDRDAIVLIPEISLTPQTIERFVGRFGSKVAVMHSKLSFGERMDQWEKILSGEAQVAVGPRSAVFAPFKNLGLIVIDEEQENSYKQEEIPRYHAKKVAEYRCYQNMAQLLMGSATPSMDSFYRVDRGDYELAKLSKRVGAKKLPEITVVNMKAEFQRGNRSIFSRELLKQLKQIADQGSQAILFLNRRGYSTFLLCRECGFTVNCPNCEVTLTYHKSIDQLLCHYCDYTEPVAEICPECHSDKIREFGAGTQRIAKELYKFLPELNTIRMDVDTTRRKNSHEQILTKFKNKEADILIGTQMIAKGLDFPEVDLVGVVSADTILNLPDFRAGEKTFQLLTQVAGRAGRGEETNTGQVVIQTYNPEHYSITAVENEQVQQFVSQELNLRKQLNYPPYTKMIRILLRGQDDKQLENIADNMATEIQNMEYHVLGPNTCPIPKIKGEYRWHVLISLRADPLESLHSQLQNYLITQKNILNQQGTIRMAIDIDPVNMM